MMGNYHVRFGGRERRVLLEARPSRPNAELGAAFLAADLGLCIEPRPDHAGYIASWIKVLQNDTRAIVQAAAHAERAVAYLHQLAHPEAIREAA
jgi:antirestriction protein ArdC